MILSRQNIACSSSDYGREIPGLEDEAKENVGFVEMYSYELRDCGFDNRGFSTKCPCLSGSGQRQLHLPGGGGFDIGWVVFLQVNFSKDQGSFYKVQGEGRFYR
jgi:hypothetical protein